jgi:hypothetical protein
MKTCTKCKQERDPSAFQRDAQKRDGLCSHCRECKNASALSYYATHRLSRMCANRDYYRSRSNSINMKRRTHAEVSGRGTWNRLHPEHFDFGSSNRKAPGESSFARLVRQYAKQARARKIEFSLGNETVRHLTQQSCSYCGIEPRQKMQSKHSFGAYIYNGIDRVDSLIGYTEENCVPCCGTCNRAKSNMSADDWYRWLHRVVVFHSASGTLFKKTIKGDEKPKGGNEDA